MKHIRRHIRAISPVLAVLMMIAVAIAGTLLVYAWVMGYLSFSSERVGEEIMIPSIANDATETDLLVYVQNLGEDAVQLDEDNCLYVNGTLVACSISGVTVADGVATLAQDETAALRYAGGAAQPGEKVTVKVTTVRGTSAKKSAYPAGIEGVSPVDRFIFETIGSPQTSGVAFSVTITALDHEGNAFLDYNGINTLIFSGGETSPAATGNFSHGIWTGEVTLTGSASEATITTSAQSNPSWTGTSNTFVLATPPAMWNQTYGGPSTESAHAIVATADGGYAIAGTSFVDGYWEVWLVKTNASGNMQWNKTYGGTLHDSGYSLIVTSDGGYAIGGTTCSFANGPQDLWLIKIDDAGNVEWNQTYWATNGWRDYLTPCCSVVEASDGGYALTGYSQSFVGIDDDFLLIKTDEYGTVEWNKTYSGPTREVTYSLIATSDGGYALAGHTETAPGDTDFWVVKTDSVGEMEWNQTYGGPGVEVAYAMAENPSGGYAVGGYTTSYDDENGYGDSDFWLVKIDGSGNMEWNQTYQGVGYEFMDSLVVTSDGGYALAGATSPTGESGDYEYDFWLVKTDASGNVEWNQTYGGEYDDYAYSVVEALDGGYAIAGYTDYFGAGNFDFWVVKTDEYGNVS